MSPQRARQLQEEFLAGFEAKLADRPDLPLPSGGTIPSMDLRRQRRWSDDTARMRQAVATASGTARPDRGLLDRLPRNPSAVWEFRRRVFFRESLLLSVAAACVADVESLARGGVPASAGVDDLHRALAALQGVDGTGAPVLVGVFSPSGWAGEVAATLPDDARRRVVLVAPDPAGGFLVTERDGRTSAVGELFDPEPETRKLQRAAGAVRLAVESLTVDDLVVPAELARTLRVPARLAVELLDDLCARRSDLRMRELLGKWVVWRVPATAAPAGLLQRLGLARLDEPAEIERLSEARARLTLHRRQAWQDADRLAVEESALLARGRAADTDGERSRAASLLAGVRKSSAHLRRVAESAGRQLAVLTAHLHNLELIALGRLAELPTTADLEAAADKARTAVEDVLDHAAFAADQVVEGPGPTADVEAILREFESGREAELRALLPSPESLPRAVTTATAVPDSPEVRTTSPAVPQADRPAPSTRESSAAPSSPAPTPQRRREAMTE